MSDPAIVPTSIRGADPGAGPAAELVLPVALAYGLASATLAFSPVASAELYVSFRQLLI